MRSIGINDGKIYIRLTRNKYFKPRICPECHKLAFLGKDWRSIHCRKCSRKIHKRAIKAKMKAKRKAMGLSGNRYNGRYFRKRKELIAKHPYCSLCGAVENLTTHHVGKDETGQHLTVLCAECHQAYEAWAQKKTIKGKVLWLMTGQVKVPVEGD